MKIDPETAYLAICAIISLSISVELMNAYPVLPYVDLFIEGIFLGWVLFGNHSLLSRILFRGEVSK